MELNIISGINQILVRLSLIFIFFFCLFFLSSKSAYAYTLIEVWEWKAFEINASKNNNPIQDAIDSVPTTLDDDYEIKVYYYEDEIGTLYFKPTVIDWYSWNWSLKIIWVVNWSWDKPLIQLDAYNGYAFKVWNSASVVIEWFDIAWFFKWFEIKDSTDVEVNSCDIRKTTNWNTNDWVYIQNSTAKIQSGTFVLDWLSTSYGIEIYSNNWGKLVEINTNSIEQALDWLRFNSTTNVLVDWNVIFDNDTWVRVTSSFDVNKFSNNKVYNNTNNYVWVSEWDIEWKNWNCSDVCLEIVWSWVMEVWPWKLYGSISQALNYVSDNMTGGITIKVYPGVYDEYVMIGNKDTSSWKKLIVQWVDMFWDPITQSMTWSSIQTQEQIDTDWVSYSYLKQTIWINSPYVEISWLVFNAANSAWTQYFEGKRIEYMMIALLEWADNAVIKNNTIQWRPSNTYWIMFYDNHTMDDVTIEWNTIFWNKYNWIEIDYRAAADWLKIINNEIYNNGDWGYRGIYFDWPTSTRDDVLISWNKIHDNWYEGIYFRDMWDMTVSWNIIFNNGLKYNDKAWIYFYDEMTASSALVWNNIYGNWEYWVEFRSTLYWDQGPNTCLQLNIFKNNVYDNGKDEWMWVKNQSFCTSRICEDYYPDITSDDYNKYPKIDEYVCNIEWWKYNYLDCSQDISVKPDANPWNPLEFKTISEAIDNVNPWTYGLECNIKVYPWVYDEYLAITNKTVSSWASIKIQWMNSNGDPITQSMTWSSIQTQEQIEADWANYPYLKQTIWINIPYVEINWMVFDAENKTENPTMDDMGIYYAMINLLELADNAVIKNNTIKWRPLNTYWIYFHRDYYVDYIIDDVLIEWNTIFSNYYSWIKVSYKSLWDWLKIINNNIYDNWNWGYKGIDFDWPNEVRNNVTISWNKIHDNVYEGIYFRSLWDISVLDNEIYNNGLKYNDKPWFYFYDLLTENTLIEWNTIYWNWEHWIEFRSWLYADVCLYDNLKNNNVYQNWLEEYKNIWDQSLCEWSWNSEWLEDLYLDCSQDILVKPDADVQTGWEFTSIQSAINKVNPWVIGTGCTIKVYPWVYDEFIAINDKTTTEGENIKLLWVDSNGLVLESKPTYVQTESEISTNWADFAYIKKSIWIGQEYTELSGLVFVWDLISESFLMNDLELRWTNIGLSEWSDYSLIKNNLIQWSQNKRWIQFQYSKAIDDITIEKNSIYWSQYDWIEISMYADTDNLTIINNEIYDNGYKGIYFNPHNEVRDNVIISWNDIYNNGQQAMYFQWMWISDISANTIHSNGWASYVWIYFNEALNSSSSFSWNTIYENINWWVQFKSGAYWDDVCTVRITNNSVYDNWSNQWIGIKDQSLCAWNWNVEWWSDRYLDCSIYDIVVKPDANTSNTWEFLTVTDALDMIKPWVFNSSCLVNVYPWVYDEYIIVSNKSTSSWARLTIQWVDSNWIPIAQSITGSQIQTQQQVDTDGANFPYFKKWAWIANEYVELNWLVFLWEAQTESHDLNGLNLRYSIIGLSSWSDHSAIKNCTIKWRPSGTRWIEFQYNKSISDIVIESNTIFWNSYHWINCWNSTDCDDLKIKNNEIFNNNYNGIYFDTPSGTNTRDNVVISWNKVHDNAQMGIYLRSLKDLNISWNEVYDNTKAGMYLRSINDADILDNTIRGNGGTSDAWIYFYDSLTSLSSLSWNLVFNNWNWWVEFKSWLYWDEDCDSKIIWNNVYDNDVTQWKGIQNQAYCQWSWNQEWWSDRYLDCSQDIIVKLDADNASNKWEFNNFADLFDNINPRAFSRNCTIKVYPWIYDEFVLLENKATASNAKIIIQWVDANWDSITSASENIQSEIDIEFYWANLPYFKNGIWVALKYVDISGLAFISDGITNNTWNWVNLWYYAVLFTNWAENSSLKNSIIKWKYRGVALDSSQAVTINNIDIDWNKIFESVNQWIYVSYNVTATNIDIINNEVHNNNSEAMAAAWTLSGVTVSFNEMYWNTSNAINFTKNEDIEISNNTIRNNGWSLYPWIYLKNKLTANSSIKSNTIYENGKWWIEFYSSAYWDDICDVKISWNNVFDNLGQEWIWIKNQSNCFYEWTENLRNTEWWTSRYELCDTDIVVRSWTTDPWEYSSLQDAIDNINPWAAKHAFEDYEALANDTKKTCNIKIYPWVYDEYVIIDNMTTSSWAKIVIQWLDLIWNPITSAQTNLQDELDITYNWAQLPYIKKSLWINQQYVEITWLAFSWDPKSENQYLAWVNLKDHTIVFAGDSDNSILKSSILKWSNNWIYIWQSTASSVDNLIIEWNNILSSSWNGIYGNYNAITNNLNIKSNKIYSSTQRAIDLNGTANNLNIESNNIYNNSREAIRLVKNEDIAISNNNIYWNGAASYPWVYLEKNLSSLSEFNWNTIYENWKWWVQFKAWEYPADYCDDKIIGNNVYDNEVDQWIDIKNQALCEWSWNSQWDTDRYLDCSQDIIVKPDADNATNEWEFATITDALYMVNPWVFDTSCIIKVYPWLYDEYVSIIWKNTSSWSRIILQWVTALGDLISEVPSDIQTEEEIIYNWANYPYIKKSLWIAQSFTEVSWFVFTWDAQTENKYISGSTSYYPNLRYYTVVFGSNSSNSSIKNSLIKWKNNWIRFSWGWSLWNNAKTLNNITVEWNKIYWSMYQWVHGVNTTMLTNLNFVNNEVYSNAQVGISFDANQSNNVTISWSSIYGNHYQGIKFPLWIQDISITNNKIYDNGGTTYAWIYFNNWLSAGSQFSSNIIFWNWKWGVEFKTGSYPDDYCDASITWNNVYDNEWDEWRWLKNQTMCSWNWNTEWWADRYLDCSQDVIVKPGADNESNQWEFDSISSAINKLNPWIFARTCTIKVYPWVYDEFVTIWNKTTGSGFGIEIKWIDYQWNVISKAPELSQVQTREDLELNWANFPYILWSIGINQAYIDITGLIFLWEQLDSDYQWYGTNLRYYPLVLAQWSSNSSIRYSTIKWKSDAISFISSSNVVISNINIEQNYIYWATRYWINSSSKITLSWSKVAWNNIFDNSFWGVYLWWVSNNILFDWNHIYNNTRIGLEFYNNENLIITNNEINKNWGEYYPWIYLKNRLSLNSLIDSNKIYQNWKWAIKFHDSAYGSNWDNICDIRISNNLMQSNKLDFIWIKDQSQCESSWNISVDKDPDLYFENSCNEEVEVWQEVKYKTVNDALWYMLQAFPDEKCYTVNVRSDYQHTGPIIIDESLWFSTFKKLILQTKRSWANLREKVLIDARFDDHGIVVGNNDVIIDGFEIINSRLSAIRLDWAQRVELKNLIIHEHNNAKTAYNAWIDDRKTSMNLSTWTDSDNIKIINTEIYNSKNAINLSGDNIEIINSRIHDNDPKSIINWKESTVRLIWAYSSIVWSLIYNNNGDWVYSFISDSDDEKRILIGWDTSTWTNRIYANNGHWVNSNVAPEIRKNIIYKNEQHWVYVSDSSANQAKSNYFTRVFDYIFGNNIFWNKNRRQYAEIRNHAGHNENTEWDDTIFETCQDPIDVWPWYQYETISDAIEHITMWFAQSTCILYIHAWEYLEWVHISKEANFRKRIILQAAKKIDLTYEPVVINARYDDYGILIDSDYVEIDWIEIKNAKIAWIKSDWYSNIQITNSVIHDNTSNSNNAFWIYHKWNKATIKDNTLYSNNKAIFVEWDENVIKWNNISEHKWGGIESSIKVLWDLNIVSTNIIKNNDHGIYLWSWYWNSILKNQISLNDWVWIYSHKIFTPWDERANEHMEDANIIDENKVFKNSWLALDSSQDNEAWIWLYNEVFPQISNNNFYENNQWWDQYASIIWNQVPENGNIEWEPWMYSDCVNPIKVHSVKAYTNPEIYSANLDEALEKVNFNISENTCIIELEAQDWSDFTYYYWWIKVKELWTSANKKLIIKWVENAQGMLPSIDARFTEYWILVDETDYVEIKNIDFYNAKIANVKINLSNNIVLDNIKAAKHSSSDNANTYGIYSEWDFNTISWSDIYSNARWVFIKWNNNTLKSSIIKNNKVWVYIDSNSFRNVIWELTEIAGWGSGKIADYQAIEGNKIYQNTSDWIFTEKLHDWAVESYDRSAYKFSSKNKIYWNEIYNNGRYGINTNQVNRDNIWIVNEQFPEILIWNNVFSNHWWVQYWWVPNQAWLNWNREWDSGVYADCMSPLEVWEWKTYFNIQTALDNISMWYARDNCLIKVYPWEYWWVVISKKETKEDKKIILQAVDRNWDNIIHGIKEFWWWSVDDHVTVDARFWNFWFYIKAVDNIEIRWFEIINAKIANVASVWNNNIIADNFSHSPRGGVNKTQWIWVAWNNNTLSGNKVLDSFIWISIWEILMDRSWDIILDSVWNKLSNNLVTSNRVWISVASAWNIIWWTEEEGNEVKYNFNNGIQISKFIAWNANDWFLTTELWYNEVFENGDYGIYIDMHKDPNDDQDNGDYQLIYNNSQLAAWKYVSTIHNNNVYFNNWLWQWGWVEDQSWWAWNLSYWNKEWDDWMFEQCDNIINVYPYYKESEIWLDPWPQSHTYYSIYDAIKHIRTNIPQTCTINVHEWTYYEEVLVRTKLTTPAKKLIFKVDDDSKWKVWMDQHIVDWAFNIQDVSNVVIDWFKIKNWNAWGITVKMPNISEEDQNIEIKNVEIMFKSDVDESGICTAGIFLDASNAIIENALIHHNSEVWIRIIWNNNTIRDSVIYNNGNRIEDKWRNTYRMKCENLGDWIYIDNWDKNRIYRNDIYANSRAWVYVNAWEENIIWFEDAIVSTENDSDPHFEEIIGKSIEITSSTWLLVQENFDNWSQLSWDKLKRVETAFEETWSNYIFDNKWYWIVLPVEGLYEEWEDIQARDVDLEANFISGRNQVTFNNIFNNGRWEWWNRVGWMWIVASYPYTWIAHNNIHHNIWHWIHVPQNGIDTRGDTINVNSPQYWKIYSIKYNQVYKNESWDYWNVESQLWLNNNIINKWEYISIATNIHVWIWPKYQHHNIYRVLRNIDMNITYSKQEAMELARIDYLRLLLYRWKTKEEIMNDYEDIHLWDLSVWNFSDTEIQDMLRDSYSTENGYSANKWEELAQKFADIKNNKAWWVSSIEAELKKAIRDWIDERYESNRNSWESIIETKLMIWKTTEGQSAINAEIDRLIEENLTLSQIDINLDTGNQNSNVEDSDTRSAEAHIIVHAWDSIDNMVSSDIDSILANNWWLTYNPEYDDEKIRTYWPFAVEYLERSYLWWYLHIEPHYNWVKRTNTWVVVKYLRDLKWWLFIAEKWLDQKPVKMTWSSIINWETKYFTTYKPALNVTYLTSTWNVIRLWDDVLLVQTDDQWSIKLDTNWDMIPATDAMLVSEYIIDRNFTWVEESYLEPLKDDFDYVKIDSRSFNYWVEVKPYDVNKLFSRFRINNFEIMWAKEIWVKAIWDHIIVNNMTLINAKNAIDIEGSNALVRYNRIWHRWWKWNPSEWKREFDMKKDLSWEYYLYEEWTEGSDIDNAYTLDHNQSRSGKQFDIMNASFSDITTSWPSWYSYSRIKDWKDVVEKVDYNIAKWDWINIKWTDSVIEFNEIQNKKNGIRVSFERDLSRIVEWGWVNEWMWKINNNTILHNRSYWVEIAHWFDRRNIEWNIIWDNWDWNFVWADEDELIRRWGNSFANSVFTWAIAKNYITDTFHYKWSDIVGVKAEIIDAALWETVELEVCPWDKRNDYPDCKFYSIQEAYDRIPNHIQWNYEITVKPWAYTDPVILIPKGTVSDWVRDYQISIIADWENKSSFQNMIEFVNTNISFEDTSIYNLPGFGTPTIYWQHGYNRYTPYINWYGINWWKFRIAMASMPIYVSKSTHDNLIQDFIIAYWNWGIVLSGDPEISFSYSWPQIDFVWMKPYNNTIKNNIIAHSNPRYNGKPWCKGGDPIWYHTLQWANSDCKTADINFQWKWNWAIAVNAFENKIIWNQIYYNYWWWIKNIWEFTCSEECHWYYWDQWVKKLAENVQNNSIYNNSVWSYGDMVDLTYFSNNTFGPDYLYDQSINTEIQELLDVRADNTLANSDDWSTFKKTDLVTTHICYTLWEGCDYDNISEALEHLPQNLGWNREFIVHEWTYNENIVFDRLWDTSQNNKIVFKVNPWDEWKVILNWTFAGIKWNIFDMRSQFPDEKSSLIKSKKWTDIVFEWISFQNCDTAINLEWSRIQVRKSTFKNCNIWVKLNGRELSVIDSLFENNNIWIQSTSNSFVAEGNSLSWNNVWIIHAICSYDTSSSRWKEYFYENWEYPCWEKHNVSNNIFDNNNTDTSEPWAWNSDAGSCASSNETACQLLDVAAIAQAWWEIDTEKLWDLISTVWLGKCKWASMFYLDNFDFFYQVCWNAVMLDKNDPKNPFYGFTEDIALVSTIWQAQFYHTAVSPADIENPELANPPSKAKERDSEDILSFWYKTELEKERDKKTVWSALLSYISSLWVEWEDVDNLVKDLTKWNYSIDTAESQQWLEDRIASIKSLLITKPLATDSEILLWNTLSYDDVLESSYFNLSDYVVRWSIDEDVEISLTDIVQAYSVYMEKSRFSSLQKKLADMNCDNLITPRDVRIMLNIFNDANYNPVKDQNWDLSVDPWDSWLKNFYESINEESQFFDIKQCLSSVTFTEEEIENINNPPDDRQVIVEENIQAVSEMVAALAAPTQEEEIDRWITLEEIYSLDSAIKWDLNEDWSLTIDDLERLEYCIEHSESCTVKEMILWDVNYDGEIGIEDVNLLDWWVWK